MCDTYPFTLAPLCYCYNALEPYIDEETVTIHYTKHHQGYVSKLNSIIADYPHYQDWPLEKLLIHNNALPVAIRQCVRNQAGGVYNHNLYWQTMTSKGCYFPVGELSQCINETFGSFANFQRLFTAQALDVFGSGWVWLIADKAGSLQIVTTGNQDTPISRQWTPILPLDLWEHAYYLQYQNRRRDYIDRWWYVVDWPQVNANYLNAASGNC